jgi:uncharacterized membrane protein
MGALHFITHSIMTIAFIAKIIAAVAGILNAIVELVFRRAMRRIEQDAAELKTELKNKADDSATKE